MDGYPGPNRAGKTKTIRVLLACTADVGLLVIAGTFIARIENGSLVDLTRVPVG